MTRCKCCGGRLDLAVEKVIISLALSALKKLEFIFLCKGEVWMD